jgi:hypothetical protein
MHSKTLRATHQRRYAWPTLRATHQRRYAWPTLRATHQRRYAWPVSSVSPNAWLSAQPVTTFPQNSTQIRLAHSSSWTPRAAVGIGSCCCCSSRAPIRCAVVYANLPRKSCSTHNCFVNDAIYTWFYAIRVRVRQKRRSRVSRGWHPLIAPAATLLQKNDP